MKIKTKIRSLPCTISLAVACIATPISSMSLGQTLELEEIIVTAQKRSQNLQEVPLTIASFSAEAIKEYGVTNIQSLAAVTPGLVVSSTQGSPSPYIRGVGTRLATIGLGPSISVYVDERYMGGGAGALLDLPDVERVEVLKGPQGTLYGRNSIGGALRIITKDPGDEWAGSATASLGDYGLSKIDGVVSGPLTDTVRVQLSAASYQRDGYADNLSNEGNEEYDNQDYTSFRGKLHWDIADESTLKWTALYYKTDHTAGFRQNSLDAAPTNIGLALGGFTGTSGDNVAHNIAGNAKTEGQAHDLTLSIPLDSFDFMSISTYSDSDSSGPLETDGGSINVLGGQLYGEADSFSQELRFTSNNDSRLQWLIATEYHTAEASAQTTATSIQFPGLTAELGPQTVNTDSYAVLAKVIYDFSEQLTASIGARYTDEKKVQSSVATPGYLNLSGGPLPFASDASWAELTPTLDIQRQFESGMLYFTYSQGFKSGGFNSPANPKFDGTVRPVLNPEILDNFEVGYKGEFFGSRLRLNSSLFYYDYKNLQVTRAAGDGDTPTLVTQNAADADVLGFEMDLTWLATDSLALSGGFSALDSQYKDYDASAKVPKIELGTGAMGYGDIFYDASGESLLRAPDITAFVVARYDIQMAGATVPMVFSYSYTGEFQYDFIASPSTQELEQKSVGLLQARISYIPEGASWSIALWGDNLTDEEYFTEKVANSNSLRGNYAAPRTWGIELSMDF